MGVLGKCMPDECKWEVKISGLAGLISFPIEHSPGPCFSNLNVQKYHLERVLKKVSWGLLWGSSG